MRPAPGLWLVSPSRGRLYGKVLEVTTSTILWQGFTGGKVETNLSALDRDDYICIPGTVYGNRPSGYYYKNEKGPAMNFKKPDPGNGQCDAMRCKKPPTATLQLQDGVTVEVCDRHAKTAAAEGITAEGLIPISGQTSLDSEPAAAQRAEIAARSLISELEKAPFVAELAEMTRLHQEALVLVMECEVEDQYSFDFLEEIVDEAKQLKKEIESRRTKFTKPANALLSKFNSWFRPVKEALDGIKTVGGGKLSAYRAAQIAREQALIREAQAQAQASVDPELVRSVLLQASAAVPESTSTFVDRWVYEIEDENLIPREYLTPDLKKIGQEVAHKKDRTNIPGIKVKNDPIIRSGRK